MIYTVVQVLIPNLIHLSLDFIDMNCNERCLSPYCVYRIAKDTGACDGQPHSSLFGKLRSTTVRGIWTAKAPDEQTLLYRFQNPPHATVNSKATMVMKSILIMG